MDGKLLGVTAISAHLPFQACSIDAVRAVPLERWDADNKITDARFGSFVQNADLFDASAFSIAR